MILLKKLEHLGYKLIFYLFDIYINKRAIKSVDSE